MHDVRQVEVEGAIAADRVGLEPAFFHLSDPRPREIALELQADSVWLRLNRNPQHVSAPASIGTAVELQQVDFWDAIISRKPGRRRATGSRPRSHAPECRGPGSSPGRATDSRPRRPAHRSWSA